MPELPEVETVVRELDRKLKNKTIKSVEVLRGKMVALGPGTVPPKRQVSSSKVFKFIKLLKGQKIRSVSRRAKLLIFSVGDGFQPEPLAGAKTFGGDFHRDSRASRLAPRLSSYSHHLHTVTYDSKKAIRRSADGLFGIKIDGSLAMLVHLKMTGQFIYFRKSELNRQVRIINKKTAPLHSMPGKYTHVVFTFTDGSKLFYNDVRQFGYLKLVTDTELAQVRELKEFGPEPLDKKFTSHMFFTAVKNAGDRKIAIKSQLMDARFIAGIGNIYSDEILFRAKVAPTRRVSTLTQTEIKAIYRAIPFILKKGIVAGGSSVGDFIRTDGSWGNMGKYHFVYGRAGEPCKVCGRLIKSVKFNGRTGSYCSHCQR